MDAFFLPIAAKLLSFEVHLYSLECLICDPPHESRFKVAREHGRKKHQGCMTMHNRLRQLQSHAANAL